MNAALRQNTIARIERHGFTVGDSGGKRAPHAIRHPGPQTASYYVKRALTDDQLYEFADTLEALAHVGRLTQTQHRCPLCDTTADQDGYCVDAGCRNVGKTFDRS